MGIYVAYDNSGSQTVAPDEFLNAYLKQEKGSAAK
jgi:hypothetical protein